MDTFAITIWNDIVSPVFDTARTLLVVNADGTRATIDMSTADLQARPGLLRQADVACLICGAISAVSMRLLAKGGIKVVPWIRGPVEDVIEAHRAGTLANEMYLMPGCGGQGCGRGRYMQWRSGQCRQNAGPRRYGRQWKPQGGNR